jgi:hypothetical protein
MKPHLISTSAHMDNENRILEYIESYKLIYSFKNFFESVTLIETISKTNLYYLDNSGLDVFYSDLNNPHHNKGVNWVNHVSNYLIKSNIKNDDIVIFITGRYKMINTNIFSFVNQHMIKEKNEFMAKKDGDLYFGSNRGVHTFYFASTKDKFIDFKNWYGQNGNNEIPIEWEVKRYLETNNKCIILPENIILGVETRVFSKSVTDKIC